VFNHERRQKPRCPATGFERTGKIFRGVPDVQYHFHGLDPNEIVHHAKNTAIYQFENNAPIDSGHTIEGVSPGSEWMCQYESALIQPMRDVLDVEAGKYASGNRN
jgi:hypothetical protein